MNPSFVFSLILLISVSPIASAQTVIQPVVLSGDEIVGIGSVDLIDDVAINNNGDTLVEVGTDEPNMLIDGAVLFNGLPLIQEGIAGQLASPEDAVPFGFLSTDLNNNGMAELRLFISNPNVSTGSYTGIQPTVLAGDILTASGISPGSPVLGVLDSKINDGGATMALLIADDPAIDDQLDAADEVLMIINAGTQTVVAKDVDVLPGQTEIIEGFGLTANLSAFNNSDDVLYLVRLAGDPMFDHAIYLNNTLIAQEGTASPIAGRDYELLEERGMDLSNNGDIIFRAALSGDSATDEVLVRNGEILVQEGDIAPGGSQFTSFGSDAGSINISDDGDVLWFGQWNGDDDTNSGLFFNETLLVQEGVTAIDGMLVDTIASGTRAFSMSDSGEWIIFQAVLEGGVEGAFMIQVDMVGAVPGDVNCDSVVDLLDVAPFVNLILNGGFNSKADLNGDGVVDLLDVAPFVALLLG